MLETCTVALKIEGVVTKYVIHCFHRKGLERRKYNKCFSICAPRKLPALCYCCISKTLSSTRLWHRLIGLGDASKSRQTVALPFLSKTTAPFMVIVAVSPGFCANPLMLHDTALVWLIQTASSTESCCPIKNWELSLPFWTHYFLITYSHLSPIPVKRHHLLKQPQTESFWNINWLKNELFGYIEAVSQTANPQQFYFCAYLKSLNTVS